MIITKQRQNVRLVAFRKSAHTSIVNTFCTLAGEEVERGAGAGVFRDENTATITVTFFRNPLARLVSAYNHLVVSEPESSLTKWGYHPRMGFAEFIRLTVSIPDDKLDLHLQSQCRQLCEALEQHMTHMVWIGQVELLMTHWTEMKNVTDLQDTPVIPANFNAKEYKPWPEYYTPDLERQAMSAFRDDYLVWGSRIWQ